MRFRLFVGITSTGLALGTACASTASTEIQSAPAASADADDKTATSLARSPEGIDREALEAAFAQSGYGLTPIPPDVEVISEAEAIEIAAEQHYGGDPSVSFVMSGVLSDRKSESLGNGLSLLHDSGPTYVVTIGGYHIVSRGPWRDEEPPVNRTWSVFIDAETGAPMLSHSWI